MSNDPDKVQDEASQAKRAKTESPVTSDSGITCPVCLNDVTDLTRARPCGHQFDKSCIKTSVARDDRCPTCRDAIGELDFNFTPDGKFESEEVQHPDDQDVDISPEVTIRRGRRDGAMMAKVTLRADAILVAKRDVREETFAMDKEHKFHLPLVYLQPHSSNPVKLFIRIAGQDDKELIAPSADDSDDEDEDEVVEPAADEIAASQSIIRVLNYLRDQLTTIEQLVGPGSEGSDDEDHEHEAAGHTAGSATGTSAAPAAHQHPTNAPVASHHDASMSSASSPPASPSSSATASPAASQSDTSVTSAATPAAAEPAPGPKDAAPAEAVAVPVIVPPDEVISLSISPSAGMEWTYPNGILAKFVAKKMLILKFHDSDDNSSQVVRAGESVFMPEGIMMRTGGQESVLREDGKEYPLSQAFKARVTAMDQAHGYTRPVATDDDDSSDDSDDDSDDSAPTSPHASTSP